MSLFQTFIEITSSSRFYSAKLKIVEDSAKPAQPNKEKIERYRERLSAINKRKASYLLMLKEGKFPKYQNFVEAEFDIRKFNVNLFIEPREEQRVKRSLSKSPYIEPIA